MNKKFEIMWEGIRKKLGKKTKKNLPRVPLSAFLSSTTLEEANIFPECHALALGKRRLLREFFWHSGKIFFLF